ncbi:MAG: cellulose-binding family, partial [Mycobacterium sp.]|nr:cellulose-binding family [Mycobacterium sp.]
MELLTRMSLHGSSLSGRQAMLRTTRSVLRRRPGAAALVIAAGLALLGATQASAGTTAAGQVTTGSVLAANAATLSGSAAGWTGYGATVGYNPAGHAAPGSLAVTSGGAWTGGVSPQFAVTPGTRYTATGWARSAAPLAPVTVLTSLGSALRVRAVAPHAVGLALRFRNGAGSLIGTGTQIGQGLTDSTTAWTQLAPVVGFAPAGAVKAEVLFLTLDAPKGETHLFDDLSVRATTGTAAKLVGPLTTRGTAVYDATGAKVTFRGIDIDGLQYPATAKVTTKDITAARSWGANLVRIPLAENPVIPGDCAYDATYLTKVDALVHAATSAGMVALLDLHTNAVRACAAPAQQAMPDPKAVTFWQTVAARYKTNPLVAFDLYNEPHDITDTVWRNGGTVTRGGVTYTAPGLQQLYTTVRGTGATNLITASGPNWASSFPTQAPLTGTTNLIYGVHVYTCMTNTPANGGSCNPGPAGVLDPSGILNRFTTAQTTVPLMVTEFGWPDTYDGR